MRIVAFIILVVVVIWLPWWILLPYSLWYATRYFALELIVVAGCLDIYFALGQWPYYTLVATLLVASVEFIRPYLTQKVY